MAGCCPYKYVFAFVCMCTLCFGANKRKTEFETMTKRKSIWARGSPELKKQELGVKQQPQHFFTEVKNIKTLRKRYIPSPDIRTKASATVPRCRFDKPEDILESCYWACFYGEYCVFNVKLVRCSIFKFQMSENGLFSLSAIILGYFSSLWLKSAPPFIPHKHILFPPKLEKQNRRVSSPGLTSLFR